jgi:hypothetical protein|tara:strand:- start:8813 stop:9247 length:435 start_codon:yes stop_codon:yes gene_type:complete
MNLNDLYEMVHQDLDIDKTELDTESLKTPQLHNKYLIMHSQEKLKLEQLLSEKKIKRKNKWLYYTGKMSEEQLRFYGWEPFDLTILKTDVDRFIDADDDMIKLSAKLTLQQEVVDYLESVVKLISNRQWNIRAALDWIKFTQGA